MTRTRHISGSSGPLGTIARTIFLVVAAVGSIFLLITSAVVAFFIISGIVLLGLAAFAFFWGKAKITGKPFGPKAQFERARQDMEAQFSTYREPAGDAPVLDAQQTPDGWSVED